jgi:hypothetical protein
MLFVKCCLKSSHIKYQIKDFTKDSRCIWDEANIKTKPLVGKRFGRNKVGG